MARPSLHIRAIDCRGRRDMLRSSGCSDEMPRALKRRKVRRGTQNCWECKRRKTRCTFAVPTDSVCDGCKSRQVRCISQQFYEDGTDGADEATDAGNRSPSGIMPSGNRASSPLSDDHPDGMDEEMPRPSTTKRRSVRPRVRNLTDAAEMEIRVVSLFVLLWVCHHIAIQLTLHRRKPRIQ